MDLMGTPERKRFWEDLGAEHVENQKKARRERERLKRLLPVIERDLAAARAPELKTYLELQQRLTEIYLAQIEEFNPDTNVWSMPELSALARAEWCLIESQWLTLRQDAITLARLDALLNRDFDRAVAGEPAEGNFPAVWTNVRAKLAESQPWQEALRAFRADYPEFKEAVAAAMPLMQTVESLPLPERLAEVKPINLPAIRGLHYRLEAHFRKLPDGEAFLNALRPYQLRVPEADEVIVPAAGKKKSLTDRMMGFLKKP